MDANTEAYLETLQVTFNSLAHRITADANEISDLEERIRLKNVKIAELYARVDRLSAQVVEWSVYQTGEKP